MRQRQIISKCERCEKTALLHRIYLKKKDREIFICEDGCFQKWRIVFSMKLTKYSKYPITDEFYKEFIKFLEEGRAYPCLEKVC